MSNVVDLQKALELSLAKERSLRKLWEDFDLQDYDNDDVIDWYNESKKVFAEDSATDKSFIQVSRKQLEDFKKTWNNRPLFWELRRSDWDEGSIADCWLEEMNRIFIELLKYSASEETHYVTVPETREKLKEVRNIYPCGER